MNPDITESDTRKRKNIIAFFKQYNQNGDTFSVIEADSTTLVVLLKGDEILRISQIDAIDYVTNNKSSDNRLADFCLCYFRAINCGGVPSSVAH